MNLGVWQREIYLFVNRKLRVLPYLFNPLRPSKLLEQNNSLGAPYHVYLQAESRFYFYTHRSLRSIRKYFKSNKKGYGEDALFGMWSALLEAFNPSRLLEIGVFRGQTVAFWSKWAHLTGQQVTIVGVSPYENVGDEVSLYPKLNYEQDIEASFGHLGLPMFHKVKSLSTREGLAGSLMDKFGHFDLVYVDGGHDLEVVLSDIQLSSELLATGGLMVLDDAAALIAGKLPPGAFIGHPGPSEAAARLMNSDSWKYLLQVGHNVVFQKLDR